MNLKLIILFLFVGLRAQSQVITLDRMLALEGKTLNEAQGILLGYGLDIIDVSTKYAYGIKTECNPPEFFEDGCEWRCKSIITNRTYTKSMVINGVLQRTNSEGENVYHRNFEESEIHTCNLTENYDRVSNKASNYIRFKHSKYVENFNCKNEFGDPTHSFLLDIQLNKSDWFSMKNDIVNSSMFLETQKDILGDIEVKYGIKKGVYKSGIPFGILIKYTVYDDYVSVIITFDSSLNTY